MSESGMHATDSAPLLGFLVDESNDKYTVRVSGGDWILDREDVESIAAWDSTIDVEFEGRPVQVVPKEGATLGFMQSIKVTASDRPMTLPDVFLKIVGNDRLRELADSWGGQNELMAVDPDIGASPTACDVSDPNGFGLVIKKDDCGD